MLFRVSLIYGRKPEEHRDTPATRHDHDFAE